MIAGLKKISPFRFKKFSIHHDRCAMKVGTDAVLLGSWVKVSGAKQILDVGTGGGVIALMIAQRSNDNALIDAIEIEREDAGQAKENVVRSPWAHKVSVFEKSFQEFTPTVTYDLIVSNPPYFINSLLPPSAHRRRTRHAAQLTLEELVTHSIRLLNTTGTLAVVLPVQEGNNFKQFALSKGLHIRRQLAFHSRKEKPQERWLFEFGFTQGLPAEERLVLYETGSEKSKDYMNLTKDFYLY